MNELLKRVYGFEKHVFPTHSKLYERLASEGQSPKTLMISCADSRIVPEHVMQAQPGDLFVCRNAGNIVPPFTVAGGGVASTVEYAVTALGVRDIIVCGHSDCGAMKALADPRHLESMPSVAAWLRHSNAADSVARIAYPHMSQADLARAITLENIVCQLVHLRTHPSVAAGLARGDISLHGWYVDIHAGRVLGLDGLNGHFYPIQAEDPLPVAWAARQRVATAAAREHVNLTPAAA